MGKRTPKKSNKGSSGSSKSPRASSNVVRYTGPTVPKAFKEESFIVSVLLSHTGLLTSDGAGVVDNTYASVSTSYTQWAEYAELYSEFRVLSTQIWFRPKDRYSKVSTTCAPGVVCIDRADSATLPGIDEAWSYGDARPIDLESPWTVKFKMNGMEDAEWKTTTGTPHAAWTHKLYVAGLTASTTYGRTYIKTLVEFRGRVDYATSVKQKLSKLETAIKDLKLDDAVSSYLLEQPTSS